MHIPRGTPCHAGAVCPVECPNCGCDNLTRDCGSYPIGLVEFVDQCIADKVIIPDQREVALQTFSTIAGCWRSIHANHLTYLSREREERNVQHTLRTRIVELEAAIQDTINSRISAVGTGSGIVAISTPRGGGGVADSLASRGWGSTSPGDLMRRARAAQGISDAEMEAAYADREANSPGTWPRLGGSSIRGVRVSDAGITVIGGHADASGALAPGAGETDRPLGGVNATTGQVLSTLAAELPAQLAQADPTDIMDLFNSLTERHPSAFSRDGV